MMVYGVDSAIASNTQLTNGYRLYDWVMRQNSNPDFWGRTLLGHDPITREEIDYLQGKKCRIALVIRDLTEAGVSTYEGEPDALRAVEAAKGLGVPEHAGIALFAEIHSDWSINHNWMISFAQTLFENGYIPGFIGNTDSARNFNFDRQCSHYVRQGITTVLTQSIGRPSPKWKGSLVNGHPSVLPRFPLRTSDCGSAAPLYSAARRSARYMAGTRLY